MHLWSVQTRERCAPVAGGSDHTFNGIRIPVHIVTAVNALQVILRGCETAYSLDT